MQVRRHRLLAGAITWLAGCGHTLPILLREPIPVPPGLSQEPVEWSILSAFPSRALAAQVPSRIMAGSAGQAEVWEEIQKTRAEKSEGAWFPEARTPGP